MNVDEASGSSETQPQDLDDYLSEIYAVTDALEEFVNAELAYFNQMRVFIDARAIFLSSCHLRIYQIRDSARIFLDKLAASYHDTTPIVQHIRTSLHKPLQPPPLDEAGYFRMSQEFRDSVQAASCAGQSANKLFRENHDFLSFRHNDTWPSILLPIANLLSLGPDRDTSLITTAMETLPHILDEVLECFAVFEQRYLMLFLALRRAGGATSVGDRPIAITAMFWLWIWFTETSSMLSKHATYLVEFDSENLHQRFLPRPYLMSNHGT